MAPPASARYMALAGMVALLTAGFLLLARILKLGFLADFLSQTVLVGFLTGVGSRLEWRCWVECSALKCILAGRLCSSSRLRAMFIMSIC